MTGIQNTLLYSDVYTQTMGPLKYKNGEESQVLTIQKRENSAFSILIG